MNNLIFTIGWIVLPFCLGFGIYLIPKLHKFFALFGAIVSVGYALQLLVSKKTFVFELLDNFGVTLILDELSGYFILTNALVAVAVILYCWRTEKTAFFYAQTLILHGSVNAAFACADFISLYVALEVSGIAAFLLVAYPRSDRSIWVALRYLFVSNVAMLFYLIGAVLVYKSNHSFHFDGLVNAPPEAVALIFLGLLVKGGVFVSGLWLPLTHSEAETPVSAMLSGAVVKAGVYPLVRCALMVEALDPVVRVFGVGAALIGAFYAFFERDTKRMLALSTISQLGWILAAPQVAGLYALTHGLGKSALFLTAGGAFPSRNFQELQQRSIDPRIWMVALVASLSISGFPLLSGFAAKALTTDRLLPWQDIIMNVGAVGTAMVYAKFIFLPHRQQEQASEDRKNVAPGFSMAAIFLLVGLIAANGFYIQAYTVGKIGKAIATIVLGWLAYFAITQRVEFKLPRALEQFEHLIGVMSLMLIVLFWMVWARSGI
ncbi:MAG TPA: cation:proton antiporter [Oscillatoriales cyanobacterium M4454_W2019_049]|nr:MAG: cation:proton antiporter [Cyanobacteria bacterium J055]HIK30322.1 cation:proton antiporter [Oscillatoriales cyanobacterium M4454_W2019_049]